MGALERIPLLLATARVINERLHRLSDKLQEQGEHDGSTTFVNSLNIYTAEIEIACVGVFSIFEARIQQEFETEAPFKYLYDQLRSKGVADFIDKLEYYRLAINALKHGEGSSYKKLLEAEAALPFRVKKPDEDFFDEGVVNEPGGLIEIGSIFFSDMIDLIEEVYQNVSNSDARAT